jgi:D-arabinose 1-dehydrogenase-like Zn-dependent alcohol dehydrogenase
MILGGFQFPHILFIYMGRFPPSEGSFEQVFNARCAGDKGGRSLRGNQHSSTRPWPEQVRVKVHACGICAGDKVARFGLLGTQLPRVPGHEVAGVIDVVGPGVKVWKEGDRVGVGWHGGSCFVCDSCRQGDFVNCMQRKVVGLSYDGGHAEYLVVRQDALAHMPNGFSFEEAAPLMCAGVTTFNSLGHSGAHPGDTVAMQGIGGLEHLALQCGWYSGHAKDSEEAMAFALPQTDQADGRNPPARGGRDRVPDYE